MKKPTHLFYWLKNPLHWGVEFGLNRVLTFFLMEVFGWDICVDYDVNRLKLLLTIQAHPHECAHNFKRAEDWGVSLLWASMENPWDFNLVRQQDWKSPVTAFSKTSNHTSEYYRTISQNLDLFFFSWPQCGAKNKISFFLFFSFSFFCHWD